MKSIKSVLLGTALLVNCVAQAQVNPNIQGIETYSYLLKNFNIDTIWSRGVTGKSAIVAVIDQGFDISHADLKSRIVASRNFVTGGTVTWGSHGTAMASIIAGARNNVGMVGVAPDAMLLLAQAGFGGTNTTINESALLRALDWSSAMGASVINISAGVTVTDSFRQSLKANVATGIWFAPSYSAVSSMFNSMSSYALATGRNSIVVVSAGNQGLPYAGYPAQIAASTDSVGRLQLGGKMIVVGAVDSTNTIASFSNRAGHICQSSYTVGRCNDAYLTRDFYVVAPGVSLTAAQSLSLSTVANPITSISGTSPAAAFVSGGMALMRQAWPQLRAEQLVQQVLTTTTDLGSPGTDNVYGRGLVNFEAATRPTGQLRVAKISQLADGTPGSGTTVVGTNTSVSAGMARTLTANSILSTVQAIDDIGRNYTVDLRPTIQRRSTVYDAMSPYLSYTGYVPIKFNIGQFDMTTMVAATGSAVEIGRQLAQVRVMAQFGSVNERNGFIGNYGSGALALGSSSTTWQILSAEVPIYTGLDLRLSWGQGFTRVNNNDLSMIEIQSGIKTDTYQFGLVKSNLFRHNDAVSFGIGTEPRIRSGRAQITAVTGYNYRELEDGTMVGDPVINKQTMDLRQSANSVLYLGYRIPVIKNGSMMSSLSGNADSYKIGVNFTWMQ